MENNIAEIVETGINYMDWATFENIYEIQTSKIDKLIIELADDELEQFGIKL